MVDCGINKPVVREVWEQIFANELDGLPIVRVMVTHMHPDHVGLAGWHCSRWNVDEYDGLLCGPLLDHGHQGCRYRWAGCSGAFCAAWLIG